MPALFVYISAEIAVEVQLNIDSKTEEQRFIDYFGHQCQFPYPDKPIFKAPLTQPISPAI